MPETSWPRAPMGIQWQPGPWAGECGCQSYFCSTPEVQIFPETGPPSRKTGCQQLKARPAPPWFYTICPAMPAWQAQGEETALVRKGLYNLQSKSARSLLTDPPGSSMRAGTAPMGSSGSNPAEDQSSNHSDLKGLLSFLEGKQPELCKPQNPPPRL